MSVHEKKRLSFSTLRQGLATAGGDLWRENASINQFGRQHEGFGFGLRHGATKMIKSLYFVITSVVAKSH